MTPARTDANHAAMIRELRALGYTVQDTHTVKRGFPDLVVGRGGITILVEVKTGPGEPLTPAEIKWHQEWRGEPVLVAWSSEMVLAEWNRRNAVLAMPARIEALVRSYLPRLDIETGAYFARQILDRIKREVYGI